MPNVQLGPEPCPNVSVQPNVWDFWHAERYFWAESEKSSKGAPLKYSKFRHCSHIATCRSFAMFAGPFQNAFLPSPAAMTRLVLRQFLNLENCVSFNPHVS